jgi:hypothetical protein
MRLRRRNANAFSLATTAGYAGAAVRNGQEMAAFRLSLARR